MDPGLLARGLSARAVRWLRLGQSRLPDAYGAGRFLGQFPGTGAFVLAAADGAGVEHGAPGFPRGPAALAPARADGSLSATCAGARAAPADAARPPACRWKPRARS